MASVSLWELPSYCKTGALVLKGVQSRHCFASWHVGLYDTSAALTKAIVIEAFILRLFCVDNDCWSLQLPLF